MKFKEFGEKLSGLYEASAYKSVSALANASGVTPQIVTKYLSGESEPSMTRLKNLATALNVDMNEISSFKGASVEVGVDHVMMRRIIQSAKDIEVSMNRKRVKQGKEPKILTGAEFDKLVDLTYKLVDVLIKENKELDEEKVVQDTVAEILQFKVA